MRRSPRARRCELRPGLRGNLQVISNRRPHKTLDARATRHIRDRFRRAEHSHIVPVKIHLGIVLDMRTQLCDRPEAHGPVWKLRFDGAVGVERVGHAVDHSRLEDCDRARLPLGTRRLAAHRWLARDLVRPRLVARPPLGPHGVELLLLPWRTRWRLRTEQEIEPGLLARLRSTRTNLWF